MVYGEDKSKKQIKVRTRLDLFQKSLSKEPKGSFRVWKTSVQIASASPTTLYFHAVNDSKVVYRLSNHYAARPKTEMEFTLLENNTSKKIKKSMKTSQAHKKFRKSMGHNDQSDGKRAKIGLSRRQYRRWPQKLLAKTMEDAISNGYLNYLLDPNCEREPWPVFLYALVDELIESGENLRTTVPEFMRRHKKQQISERPVAGSMEVMQVGMKCKAGSNIRAVKFLPENSRTKLCVFCGRRRAMYKCRSCQQHLCMRLPQRQDGRSFPNNGPLCFLRFHGIEKYGSK